MLISIPIPESSQCILKVGQSVDFNTPFLKTDVKSEVHVHIANNLNVKSDAIFRHMKKFVGEPITKGEVIALKQGIFSTRKMVSEYDGVLKEIDHVSGDITITTNTNVKDSIKSYFKGEVSEIKKDELRLKVKSGVEFSSKKVSETFGGLVFNLKSDGSNGDPENLDMLGKVVVAENISSYLEAKYEAIGVSGLVMLKTSNESMTLPFALLKKIDDFNKIQKDSHTYCFADKKYSTIYFYD